MSDYIMTPEFIGAWVEKIRGLTRDPEAAHGEEDKLHQAVLMAISEGRCEDTKLCAFVALETRNIEFARWCA